MNICKCSDDSLERAITDLTCRRPADTQNHIKKGGYHNLETYYDDHLVKLIQAKLLSNQVNQGNRLASRLVADFNCQTDLAIKNHIKKGVVMETVIIIIYGFVFASLIYALF